MCIEHLQRLRTFETPDVVLGFRARKYPGLYPLLLAGVPAGDVGVSLGSADSLATWLCESGLRPMVVRLRVGVRELIFRVELREVVDIRKREE